MRLRGLSCAVILPLALLLAASCAALAEEGMWTFDNLPVKQLEAQYHFKPTQAWLDHVRLSSARLDDLGSGGGSGAFVSPHGLLVTNEHVARAQLQKSSTAQHDYLRDGFYASAPGDEMKCSDLEVDVLAAMQDVTGRVLNAAQDLTGEADAVKAREAAMAAIEKESQQQTGLRSEVVPLYNGSEYWLYRYKAYTDVRLVFAPERQAAFFGGDPDNFTYPRYDLDMAIYRVYENGKPLKSNDYLQWNVKGATPGELVFVAGNPAATERQDTVAQLLVERDVIEPEYIEYLRRRIAAAQQFAGQGAEQARLVGSKIFYWQNALKVSEGRHQALMNAGVMASKQAQEDELRARVAANPAWQTKYGGAWETIARAEEIGKPEIKAQIFRRMESILFGYALTIVEYTAEVQKRDSQRMPGYNDAALSAARFQVLAAEPVNAATEKLYLSSGLKLACEELGAGDAFVQALTGGGAIDAAVNAMVDGTRLADAAFRKSLLDGGEAAVNASTDPMIEAARRAAPILVASYRHRQYDVEGAIAPAAEKLGRARFAVYGKNAYPDATYPPAPRLSYGAVEGYPYNGTVAPPFTTYFGLFDRSASFGDKAPFDLAPKEAAARGKLDLATPLNFACSADITGGSSGSPVIDRQGELVGVIFDGNIESLAGTFVYDRESNRGIAVDAAGMMEALRTIYGAGALADEIQGTGR